MKYVLLPFYLLCFSPLAFAQDLSGQWKGEFIENSTSINGFGGNKCEYVLDLECKGKNVSGYSYTYFTDGGKRYYTICRLVGWVDRKNQYIEVKEIERTKTNVPMEVRNCFQVHKLTYTRGESNEILSGSWIPAPKQDGSCGHGMTSLTRRALRNSFPGFNATANKPISPDRTRSSQAKIVKKDPPKPATRSSQGPTLNTIAKTPEKNITLKPNRDSFTKTESPRQINIPKIIAPVYPIEKRNNSLIKTIEVENAKIKVDLYDNGEVDGDSISLFYNNKLIVSHKRLTEKPLTLTIDVDDKNDLNELVMYAENLGSIPPNTALMIVTDGPNRYEVRITSDLKKNGSIRFVHRPPTTGKKSD